MQSVNMLLYLCWQLRLSFRLTASSTWNNRCKFALDDYGLSKTLSHPYTANFESHLWNVIYTSTGFLETTAVYVPKTFVIACVSQACHWYAYPNESLISLKELKTMQSWFKISINNWAYELPLHKCRQLTFLTASLITGFTGDMSNPPPSSSM
jgi:hypothetical protein